MALALGSLVGGVLAEPSSSGGPDATPRVLPDPGLAGLACGGTAATRLGAAA